MVNKIINKNLKKILINLLLISKVKCPNENVLQAKCPGKVLKRKCPPGEV